MANTDAPRVPPPSAEHRRVAAGQFEHANQVIATGNFDYGIGLLLSCCKLDPANLIYRQALRRTEKTKYKNNMRGSWHAKLSSLPLRTKIKSALRSQDYLRVLELGEEVLSRNPWDTGAQIDMATAADSLGLLDLAVWTMEQARHKDPAMRRSTASSLGCTRSAATSPRPSLCGNWSAASIRAMSKHRASRKTWRPAKRSPAAATMRRRPRGRRRRRRGGPAGRAAHPRADAADRRSQAGPVRATPSPDVAATERGAREAAQVRARIDADPTNANAYLQLAALHRKNGHLDQARAVLQQGLGPTGNAFEIASEIADLDIETLRRDLALTEERQRATPQDEDVRQIRLRLMKEINNRELELYRRKADRFPTEMVHRFELGVRLLRAGQVDEAIRELQAARSDPRQHWRSLLYLAYCFKTRNNWRLAKRNFEECLQNLPAHEQATRKEVLFQLAQGSAEAGDLSAAIELAHELANLDFAYKDIGRLLDEWQTKLEQADV